MWTIIIIISISFFRCERKEYASFQCHDLSDETDCVFEPQPLKSNPAMKSLQYDSKYQCFKQAFTFNSLNESVMKQMFPDDRQREFHQTYEYSAMKLVILGCLACSGALGAISVILLLCIGNFIKRCKVMSSLLLAMHHPDFSNWSSLDKLCARTKQSDGKSKQFKYVRTSRDWNRPSHWRPCKH